MYIVTVNTEGKNRKNAKLGTLQLQQQSNTVGHLGAILFKHTDGFWVDGCGLSLQVCNGAVSLDGQDGVGLRHMYCVLDVGGAPILQLDLLQAALVICFYTETRGRGTLDS